MQDLAHSELDLRISAAKLRYGGVQADDAAMSVLLKGGRMELTIADAQAYKGTSRLGRSPIWWLPTSTSS